VRNLYPQPGSVYARDTEQLTEECLQKRSEIDLPERAHDKNSCAQNDDTLRKDLNAEDLAFIFLGSIRFTVTTWRLGGFKYDLRTRGDSLKATLMNLIW